MCPLGQNGVCKMELLQPFTLRDHLTALLWDLRYVPYSFNLSTLVKLCTANRLISDWLISPHTAYLPPHIHSFPLNSEEKQQLLIHSLESAIRTLPFHTSRKCVISILIYSCEMILPVKNLMCTILYLIRRAGLNIS